ncbi:hypothetical protein DFH07DRAFT_425107 [Mycena maculata]|uniref:MARVEL domain-containing protein n=1 Tax=Mycena maculata TaxID=230809 RepID=A0AAD7JDW0_9AGAR|nr:hypothetical protein DFH07DRAFT_425107 [Mycena maculata]
MAVIPIIRLITLSAVVLFSLIALGAGSAALTTPFGWLSVYTSASALAVATAALTSITLPVMIVVEFVRPGGFFTSMIVFELAWLSVLWVLWLATGGLGVDASQQVFPGQDCNYDDPTISANCTEIVVIEAFAFLCWIILLFYTNLILILAIIAASRNHAGVWTSGVSTAPFFVKGAHGRGGFDAGLGANAMPMKTTGGYYAGAGGTGMGGVAEAASYEGPARLNAGTVHV